MDITIYPRKLSGTVAAIPSKSLAHRYLICAALADKPTMILCPTTSKDIEATAHCLTALGAKIQHTQEGYHVTPIGKLPQSADLYCGESGSTLRFLLPVVGALGIAGTFHMEGRLASRPLSPMWEEMERMGCHLSRPQENTILCTGQLHQGSYTIPGNISSQFISGFLFAHAILGNCDLKITDEIESKPYIILTVDALAAFGVPCTRHYPYHLYLPECPKLTSPGTLTVEGDWSNGAFWIVAQKIGNDISVTGLDMQSHQGDRRLMDVLKQYCVHAFPDVAEIPDLVPILSILATCVEGCGFRNYERLRLKESDRVEAIIQMITALGGKAYVNDRPSELSICGRPLKGGTVDSFNDHRIAMSAAIAATVCTEPVTILGAECVNKSYPTFWEEYKRLGGHYEQHLR